MSIAQVRTVGANGQISLGKEFAGKMVLIDQINAGTWLVKAGQFIPDSEQWIHEPEHLAKLDKALAWAAENPPQDNFAQIMKKAENILRAKKKS